MEIIVLDIAQEHENQHRLMVVRRLGGNYFWVIIIMPYSEEEGDKVLYYHLSVH